MNKKFECLFDNLIWFIIYSLPLLLLLFNWFRGDTLGLVQVFEDVGLSIVTDNVVFSALSSLFGANGVFPIFVNADVLSYFTYFACMVILHLIIDVLLFIPRGCHKLLDNFGKGGVIWKH